MKCNITIDVNHLAEDLKSRWRRNASCDRDAAGRDVVFKGASLVEKLPEVLNVHMMRFFWKQATSLDAAGTQGVKTKILRGVSFPMTLTCTSTAPWTPRRVWTRRARIRSRRRKSRLWRDSRRTPRAAQGGGGGGDEGGGG